MYIVIFFNNCLSLECFNDALNNLLRALLFKHYKKGNVSQNRKYYYSISLMSRFHVFICLQWFTNANLKDEEGERQLLKFRGDLAYRQKQFPEALTHLSKALGKRSDEILYGCATPKRLFQWLLCDFNELSTYWKIFEVEISGSNQ